jgi:hypothetical protein
MSKKALLTVVSRLGRAFIIQLLDAQKAIYKCI